MDIYERLKRVANIEPSCFLGDGCSMHEIARDALIELAGKKAVIGELAKTKQKTCKQRDRLLTLAVKWCDRSHQDWNEIKAIYDECSFDDLIDSGGIALVRHHDDVTGAK